MANRPRNNKNPKFRSRNQQKNGVKTKKITRNVRNRVAMKAKVTDARHKILQKKRKTVTDARDVLAKMAKSQDARSKILKLRQGKGEHTINGSVRAIGSNILQRTDRNGKISLVTSKNKQNTSGMSLAIQQQLGLIAQQRKKIALKRSPVAAAAHKPLTSRGAVPIIRKTIMNDLDYHPAVASAHYDSYANEYLALTNSRIAPAPTMRSPLSSFRHTLLENSNDWRTYESPGLRSRLPPPPPPPTSYIDLDAPEDEEMPIVSSAPKQTIFIQGTSRSSNVHSRLDNKVPSQQSHGIFAGSSKTKVVVPTGHRIVVSNLQPSVTQDDIRELFEDIGQLLCARLVRPGTAEVIYKSLKDAQKAVDTYHNRQLDGQPMKCLLVNKRPLNNPTGPAITPKQDIRCIYDRGVLFSKFGPTLTVMDWTVPDVWVA